MKHFAMPLFILIIIFSFIVPVYCADDGNTIIGTWETTNKRGKKVHIETYKLKNKYYGKISWLEEPLFPADDREGMANQPKIDRRNPDPEKRTLPVLGLVLLKDFEYNGDNKWQGGTIYDPENGKTYKCKMTLTDNGILKIRGYIGISLLGRTTEWTRFKEKVK
jgi:uncharacterized protein (DUF2147 family)